MSDLPKNIGIVRQSNPTPSFNGQNIKASFDDLGRQLMTPYQVRDLIATARASITVTGEQTLLAGSADVFRDMVRISGANQSTNAVSISIRDATGGGIVHDFEIPANNTIEHQFLTPYPQNTASAAWTVQVDDFVSDGTTSNGTVIIDALFVNNV